MAKILVVDDEPGMLKVLRIELEDLGYEVETASNGIEALAVVESGGIDLVVTDVRMPGMTGDVLLREIKSRYPSISVIIMTAFGKVEDAVLAMQSGASDYLLKPVDSAELGIKIASELNRRRLALEVSYLRKEVESRGGYEDLIGQSRPMQSVFDLIERVSRSDATVLILGESGTGKELVARAIHRRSQRREHAFVPINCVAIPEDLLESELFGHVRGAFTGASETRLGKFELANEGSLFLDEIGDMRPGLQGKLLRAIQEKTIEPVGGRGSRPVDVRILAATNADLNDRVRKGEFREDLYYRLNVVPIRIPPLRERKEDIPLLVRHFLNHYGKGRVRFEIQPEVFTDLSRYAWPGNVRELQNLVERAVVLDTPDVLRLKEIDPLAALREPEPSTGDLRFPRRLLSRCYKDAKEEVTNALDAFILSAALKSAHGNVSRAAEHLGMHRKNFHMKVVELGIDPKQFSDGGE